MADGSISLDPVVLVSTMLLLATVILISHYRTLKSRALAEARSLNLLLQHLAPDQRAQYNDEGCFDVIGSCTGKCYRISHGTACNVRELVDDKCVVGWCFFPQGKLPAGDCMLAQKIALESFEDEALRVAHRFTTHRASVWMN